MAATNKVDLALYRELLADGYEPALALDLASREWLTPEEQDEAALMEEN